jgi:hypothetical protein
MSRFGGGSLATDMLTTPFMRGLYEENSYRSYFKFGTG